MALHIDANLDPSLYPLAWLIGEWKGTGAVQLLDEDGSEVGRGIEQELTIEAESSTLRWSMRTWVLDAPAPEPPTAVFYDNDEPEEEPAEAPEATEPPEVVRELLIEENGTWRNQGPLAGQDLEAAKTAKPGTPESYLSHAVTLTMRRTSGFGEAEAEHWAGEVRGPRIQLGSQDIPDPHNPSARIMGTRMFGLVGGRLMWLQEVGESLSALRPHMSVELERVEHAPESAELEA